MRKLKVVINAYACAPNMGSEQGMAWNWCTHLAKYSELFIITEAEHRDKIEIALEDHKYKDNLHFYYIPVTEKVRKMCYNQGDWRFYYYYERWQRRALETAKKIIFEEQIDILHQLNMIGFREPGYLWKVKNIPFVWGPIGGLSQFPSKYLSGADTKLKVFFQIKSLLNTMQIKYSSRVNKAIKRSKLLISATPDSSIAIKKYKNYESIHIPDQGSYIHNFTNSNNRFNSAELELIWVGKFDFRKQLHVAIKTIAATKNKKINLNVYGNGSEKQVLEAKSLCRELKIQDQVIFHGFKSNEIIKKAMREADLFFFTSVNEGTPTVVMEAIGNNLPILCYDACGFGAIVDETIGIKLPLTNPKDSIEKFSKHLNILFANRDILKEYSNNCKIIQEKYSWENISLQLTELYHNLVEN